MIRTIPRISKRICFNLFLKVCFHIFRIREGKDFQPFSATLKRNYACFLVLGAQSRSNHKKKKRVLSLYLYSKELLVTSHMMLYRRSK